MMASSKVRIRPAETRDIDMITTIVCAAMMDDPQWQYRYPHRENYFEDTFAAVLQGVRSAMSDETVFINVATLPTAILDENDDVAVAVAMWELPTQGERSSRKHRMLCSTFSMESSANTCRAA
jgi:hypothetical protein